MLVTITSDKRAVCSTMSTLEALAIYNIFCRSDPATNFEAVTLLNLTNKLRIELNKVTKK